LHTVFFITHPDVWIDPRVPVPEWPLDERGQARMRALATRRWVQGVRSICASGERKARDAAQLLADGLGLDGYRIIDSLAENDRSATGYLLKQEFEATADAFFAQPQSSIRGWETAAHAQTRIIQAIEAVLRTSEKGDIAVAGHGALERCSIAILPACRSVDSMSSLRQMVETGLLLIGRAESFCTPGGGQSTHLRRKADQRRSGPPGGIPAKAPPG